MASSSHSNVAVNYEMPPTPATIDGFEDEDVPSSYGISANDKTHDIHAHDHVHEHIHSHDDTSNAISKVSATSKAAAQAVAPFLARHIPHQYAPHGSPATTVENQTQTNLNTKYCYRHRPDLKCRSRTVDEPSMEMLQKDLQALSQRDQQAITHVWSVFSAAPPKHRQLLLQGLLTQCCFPQLSYLSSSVRDLIRIDFIAALPTELSMKILSFLDTISLCKAAQVSRKWRELADDDQIWHLMCEQHIDRKCTRCGWGLPLLERKRLFEYKREREQQQLRNADVPRQPSPTASYLSLKSSVDDSPKLPPAISVAESRKRTAEEDETDSLEAVKRQCLAKTQSYRRPWKDVYKDRFKVGTNWKHGRHSMKVIKAHDNGVMCLQFDDHILATGSYDATIKIWNIETGKLIRTLKGHTSGVRALQFDDSKLISGSLDRTIKIWNWRTGECVKSLQGHEEGVVSIHFEGNTLVSGSIDKTIKVFNFTDKSVFSLKGHTDWINQVKVDMSSRTIFSASDDGTAKLWDLDTRQCIRTFKGHVGQVQQILVLPAEFEPEEEDVNLNDDAISISSSSDIASEVDAKQPENHRSNLGPGFSASNATSLSRPLPPRYMLTGSLDATLRLWDVHAGRCIKKFFGHVEGVWALAADTLRVVSGAEDRMVKIWDTRSGKCDRTFTGHVGPVNCIALSDSRMVTGSEDCEVRIYSFGAGDE